MEGEIAAALYWFDCDLPHWASPTEFSVRKLAYLYAVATAKAHQGQGLCRALMENTHEHLRQLGYDGCILSPQSEGLFTMYGKLGYTTCGHILEFSCSAAGEP